jgi:LPXTG-site transpeptidase (sortase) family protein
LDAEQEVGEGFVARATALPEGSSGYVSGGSDRIVIPALGVSAPVVPISAAGGTLVPPSSPAVIGWWSGGARPGAATGTAVLTGHTVSSGGGALDDLDLMSAGQRVRIDSDGHSLSYVVTSVTIYRKASLAEHAAKIFDQSVSGRVALVTCEDWNGSIYLSNVVVVADPRF